MAAAACAHPQTGSTVPTPGGTAPTPAPRGSRPAGPPIQLPPTKDDGPWDMSWLDRVDRARYKLMFDVGAYLEGGGLYYA